MTNKQFNKPEMNKLRDILRIAQNEVKMLEWSEDPDISGIAVKIWVHLDDLRGLAGRYR